MEFDEREIGPENVIQNGCISTLFAWIWITELKELINK